MTPPGTPSPDRPGRHQRPRPLTIAGCRSECAWAATGERLGEEALFACAGCGSEWVASEPWTPIDWTGVVPEPVQRERERRGRG
ncbi:MAG TPA: hypothetical protein VFY86_17050 [Nocardioides sp.]|nr:hypothetical protein [uncultured Nocardioides sp.]HEX5988236.1 hypothetical protein [Nocardioides sp.]